MRPNRLEQKAAHPHSLLASLAKLPATHVFLYSLIFCSILTVLYVAVIHFFLPATSSPAPPPGAASSPTVLAGCVVGGCSGELCRNASSKSMFSTCVWLDEYRCYKEPFAICAPSADTDSGGCEWQPNEEMRRCLEAARIGSGGDKYVAARVQ